MIVFACAITEPDVFAARAAPGIELAAEPDSEVLRYASTGSLYRNYNLILDKVAEMDGVEALVLLHQDAEIVDPEFLPKLREALSDPEVAIVGCAGAIGVRSIAWWEGSITWASFTHRYEEHGGGEIPAFAWLRDGEQLPPYAQTGEVDAVDGFVIGISPWAIEHLRFDESLGQHHGYDLDYCLQARAAGKKVLTASWQVVHHHSLDLISDVEAWIQAHMKVAEKWDGTLLPEVGAGDWKQRARRAEAEASAARLIGGLAGILRDAQAKDDTRRIGILEQELLGMRQSKSWQMTAPLRALGRMLRSRRGREGSQPG